MYSMWYMVSLCWPLQFPMRYWWYDHPLYRYIIYTIYI